MRSWRDRPVVSSRQRLWDGSINDFTNYIQAQAEAVVVHVGSYFKVGKQSKVIEWLSAGAVLFPSLGSSEFSRHVIQSFLETTLFNLRIQINLTGGGERPLLLPVARYSSLRKEWEEKRKEILERQIRAKGGAWAAFIVRGIVETV